MKFNFIIYADDTTLYTALGLLNPSGSNEEVSELINLELDKISAWLKLNKLSLNIKKTKFMIFYQPQRTTPIPTLKIDNTLIECVNEFNFLGLVLDKNVNWNNHIQKTASKISQITGIMNRLKHFLPPNVLQIIYNSLVLPRLNYCLLAWGHKFDRLFKIQKKAVRIVNHSKYNAHTDPIFKSRNLLKLEDIYVSQVLKFYYKLQNGQLPAYFSEQFITSTSQIHDHNTRRNRSTLFVKHTQHIFAKKCLRHEIVRIINNTPEDIVRKVHTHSYIGFSLYTKNYFLGKYTEQQKKPISILLVVYP